MKKISLIIILFFHGLTCLSQYFSTGADPGDIKWKQINDSNFQVIYPAEFEIQAKRFFAMLQKVYDYGQHSLGTPTQKISIVLHSETINSNGMVATAPRRMEIYPTPHQDIYAQEWLKQLAVHEYRHVVQIDKINQDLPSVLKIIFGEQATAIIIGAYLPFWFLEGDAVIAETAQTETGRGRDPSFLMENKAQLLEKEAFSFNKITLGSYRDFVPNRYAFGWWFVGGIRVKYGSEIWNQVLNQIAQKPLSLNPMNRILKQKTGYNKEQLYALLWNQYREDWQSEIDSLSLNTYAVCSKNDLNTYTNYLNTNSLADGSIVCVRKSRGDIPRIVRIKDFHEEILYTPGSMVERSFSSEDNLLIWAEISPNIRWAHKDHSRIIIFDVTTKEKKIIHTASNLASPVINPELDRFLAVSSNEKGEYAIQVHKISDGSILQTVKIGDNDYIISPTWGNSSDIIYFIGLNEEGKYIASYDLILNKLNYLTKPVKYDISNLSFHNDTLTFTSSKTGRDNPFMLNIRNGEIYQLTESKFGADHAHFHDQYLYYSNYTSDGYQLVRTQLSELKFKLDSSKQVNSTNSLAEHLSSQEIGKIDFTTLDTTNLETSNYHKFSHLMNIHSWAPVAIDISNQTITTPGISMQSQNVLGTSLTDLGYLYNLNEKRGQLYLNYQYIGFFPILGVKMNYAGRNIRTSSLKEVYSNLSWDELNLVASASIPLSFSTGKYNQTIQPEINYHLSKSFHLAGDNGFQAVSSQLFLTNIQHRSELDLQTKWGQIVQLNYGRGIKSTDDFSSQFSIATSLYFPGIAKYDGFKLYFGYQWRDQLQLNTFNDFIATARGYVPVNSLRLNSSMINYTFPIANPDWSISKILYIQRLKANVFCDYTQYNYKSIGNDFSFGSSQNEQINSLGIELSSEGFLFRLPTPIVFGIRGIYLSNLNSFASELIFSVNFIDI
ncbi:MAG: hypothetical protein ACK5IJ_00225 [Mangrovibacterium sp.]